MRGIGGAYGQRAEEILGAEADSRGGGGFSGRRRILGGQVPHIIRGGCRFFHLIRHLRLLPITSYLNSPLHSHTKKDRNQIGCSLYESFILIYSL